MKKLLSLTLGILTAVGAFIDIGDLVTDALVGARYGLNLVWVTVLAVVGIAAYAEMAGRVATTVRTSAPVMVRMSSTAKTFDGSAMATMSRPSFQPMGRAW